MPAILERAAVDNALILCLCRQSCVVYLRGDLGVTLGGILLATGTAPPAVSISGTLSAVIQLHIEIDSTAGGTGVGQATFKWSVDGGTTFVQTGVATAASVALGATGILAQFPAGPYNTDNRWDVTLNAWGDQSGVGNNPVQAGATLQPKVIANARNWRPSFRFDGVNDLLAAAFALSEPTTVVCALKLIAIDGTVRTAWDGAPAANVETMWTVFETTQSSIVDSNVVPLAGTLLAAGAFHIVSGVYNHTAARIRVDRVETLGSLGAASATIGGLSLGGAANGAFPLNCEIMEMVVCNAAVSSVEINRIERDMQARYALQ